MEKIYFSYDRSNYVGKNKSHLNCHMPELISEDISETLKRNWFFLIANYLTSKKGWSAPYIKDCLAFNSEFYCLF